MQFRLAVFLSLTLAFTFTACKNDNLIRRGDTVEVAYTKAKAIFDSGDYVEAANAFESVTRVSRGTEFGQDAQYYLAESYYNSKQYLLAASEYDRYVSYYPQDARREEIEFKSALCYFYQSPRYNLDQTNTYTAIERFQLFNSRFPNSPYVSQSAEKINELRVKLARKSYEAAQFYVRTNYYEAATIYLGLTIDRYPETSWAEKALVQQAKVFIDYADNSVETRQAERYQKAIDAYEKFLQLFPQSSNRAEIEGYHDEARQKLNAAQKGQTTEK